MTDLLNTIAPETPARQKRGMLTLEWIIGDQTYWLTSGFERNVIGFTQLARNLFDCELIEGQMAKNGSEIEAFEPMPDQPTFFFRPDGTKPDGVGLVTNLETAPFLTWSQLASKLLHEGVSPTKAPSLWYQGLMAGCYLKARPECPLEINKDIDYLVTAFLPPPDDEGILAIMGEDYKSGTNPNWITIKRDTEESYVELLKGFDIVAFKWGDGYLNA